VTSGCDLQKIATAARALPTGASETERGKGGRSLHSSPFPGPRPQGGRGLAPLGQRIAVARDVAFAFSYPHLLQDWRDQGASISFFSPLADEAPAADADAVYLPGGYPELYADRIAATERFRAGMEAAAGRGTLIYGECGGYMVLGNTLTDKEGKVHRMLGMLPVSTSFEKPKLHLGYRRLMPLSDLPWSAPLSAHEFHFASVVREGEEDRLFEAEDAEGEKLGAIGLRRKNVMGSFAHVIDAT
jgi:cobyrinic acid a,c-diamide synthase